MKKTNSNLRAASLLVSAISIIGFAISAQPSTASEDFTPQTYVLNLQTATTPLLSFGNNQFFPIQYTLALPQNFENTDFTLLVNGTPQSQNLNIEDGRLVTPVSITDEVELSWGGSRPNSSVSTYVNGPFSVGRVVFDFNKSNLSSDSRRVIRAVARHLGDTKFKGIYLVGNADKVGSQLANSRISQARVIEVKNYLEKQLVRLGIDNVNIETEFMADFQSKSSKIIKNEVDRNVSFLIFP